MNTLVLLILNTIVLILADKKDKALMSLSFVKIPSPIKELAAFDR